MASHNVMPFEARSASAKGPWTVGWSLKREGRGSHRILERSGFPDFTFAFHDADEIGPRMLARVAKHTGLNPSDL